MVVCPSAISASSTEGEVALPIPPPFLILRRPYFNAYERPAPLHYNLQNPGRLTNSMPLSLGGRTAVPLLMPHFYEVNLRIWSKPANG